MTKNMRCPMKMGPGELCDGEKYVTFWERQQLAETWSEILGDARLIAFELAFLNSCDSVLSPNKQLYRRVWRDTLLHLNRNAKRIWTEELMKGAFEKEQLVNVIESTKGRKLVKNLPTLQAISKSAENIVRNRVDMKLVKRKLIQTNR